MLNIYNRVGAQCRRFTKATVHRINFILIVLPNFSAKFSDAVNAFAKLFLKISFKISRMSPFRISAQTNMFLVMVFWYSVWFCLFFDGLRGFLPTTWIFTNNYSYFGTRRPLCTGIISVLKYSGLASKKETKETSSKPVFEPMIYRMAARRTVN